MSQYALIFKSIQAFDWTKLPQAQAQEAASAWGDWIASMGPAVQVSEAVKFGGKRVGKDGTDSADNLTTGFVVIEAEDFGQAEKLAKNAPSIATGQGAIEVYEILPTRH